MNELRDYAIQVANVLGWQVGHHTEFAAEIVGPAFAAVRIRFNEATASRAAHFAIEGLMPIDSNLEQFSLQPRRWQAPANRWKATQAKNVRADATPEHTAREIQNRVLTRDYFALVVVGLEDIEATADYNFRKAETRRRLVEAGAKDNRGSDLLYAAGECYGEIQANAGSADLKLRCVPIDKAVAILCILNS